MRSRTCDHRHRREGIHLNCNCKICPPNGRRQSSSIHAYSSASRASLQEYKALHAENISSFEFHKIILAPAIPHEVKDPSVLSFTHPCLGFDHLSSGASTLSGIVGGSKEITTFPLSGSMSVFDLMVIIDSK